MKKIAWLSSFIVTAIAFLTSLNMLHAIYIEQKAESKDISNLFSSLYSACGVIAFLLALAILLQYVHFWLLRREDHSYRFLRRKTRTNNSFDK